MHRLLRTSCFAFPRAVSPAFYFVASVLLRYHGVSTACTGNTFAFTQLRFAPRSHGRVSLSLSRFRFASLGSCGRFRERHSPLAYRVSALAGATRSWLIASSLLRVPLASLAASKTLWLSILRCLIYKVQVGVLHVSASRRTVKNSLPYSESFVK